MTISIYWSLLASISKPKAVSGQQLQLGTFANVVLEQMLSMDEFQAAADRSLDEYHPHFGGSVSHCPRQAFRYYLFFGRPPPATGTSPPHLRVGWVSCWLRAGGA